MYVDLYCLYRLKGYQFVLFVNSNNKYKYIKFLLRHICVLVRWYNYPISNIANVFTISVLD